MNKRIFFILACLSIAAFIVRLYRFDGPIADWHSWRQADTAEVTRNFVREGLHPLYPKFDSFNSLNQYQLPNPDRYFFAEFPIYNILSYFGFTLAGHFTIEEWGRLVSIFFSSATVGILYLLVQLYSGKRIGLLAAALYAFLPYNIYYGRVIMPDPMHIFWCVSSLYLVSRWVRSPHIWWAIPAGFAYSLALLTKPYALVLLLPITFLILGAWKHRSILNGGVYVFLVISLVPFLLWRWHINHYPQGQFDTSWLYNGGDIRFTGAYFRWLIFDRMNRLIFATGGFVLFWIGIIRGDTKKEGLFYYVWLASIGVFFVVIAKGNVTHDYYQMPLVPIGVIFIAKGIDFLFTFGKGMVQRSINASVAIVLVLILLAFGWYEVRDYFNINHPEIVAAGKAVDRLLPKDATVIAPYDNDSAFLYQANRLGWTYGGDKISKWRQEGADYLVSVNYDETTNYWMNQCKVFSKNPQWVIIDLKQCKKDTISVPLTP